MRNMLRDLYLRVRTLLLKAVWLPRFFAGPAPAAPRSILFIRVDRLGDMVMSTPALKALEAAFPSARLTVLASAVNAPLLAGNPSVDEVMVWNPGGSWTGAIAGLLRLRAAGFDAAIDPLPEYDLRTALIAFFSGAGFRLGYDIAGRGVFFTAAAEPPRPRLHFADEIFHLLRTLGVEQRGETPELFSTPAAEAEAARILAGSGVAAGLPLIAVHPGGHYESQRWPAERFAAAASWLVIKYRAAVLLIGSAAESGPLAGIELAVSAGRGGKCLVKAVDLPADVLAALLRRCRLFIGNNSGPLHMAGALGVPSVSTMGPTDPVRWSPRGCKQVVLNASPDCAPCSRGVCFAQRCLKDISVEDMIAAAEKLMDENMPTEKGGK